ncbi:hypothetical protein [Thalassotalea sp. PLHSN55]|uniref:hypothetical protein n=1 Tax=Thalassotalea sp. PLHSN55 TaxID=3435888 RepID=UPI003F8701B0
MLKQGGLISVVCFCLVCNAASSAEIDVRGIVDIRASHTDSIDSYVHGGYGKFSASNGNQLSLAQLGLDLSVRLDNGFSAHGVVNGFSDSEETEVGFTEAFIKYKSLPNENGYRWQNKFGIFYPNISYENEATAWSSRYTLNSSAINTWLAEEVRLLGNEISLTRLGKFNDAPYDLNFSATAFKSNDPVGALLSWHGWTISQRQTLWNEKRTLPNFEALRPGNPLETQAKQSDPFTEIDKRLGFHGRGAISFHQQGELSLGYYHNNAQPYKVIDGQYAWKTRFIHAGLKWKLAADFTVVAQYLKGDTLMQNPDRFDMVNNDYHSAFVLLSKKINTYRASVRLEEFSVIDNDSTQGDDNNEYGKSATFNVSKRLSRQLFISTEYLWVKSRRAARAYVDEPVKLTEQQLQLAARYYF